MENESIKFACLILGLTVSVSVLLHIIPNLFKGWYPTAPYQIGKWYELNCKDPWGRGENIIYKAMDIRDGHTLIQYKDFPGEKFWVSRKGTRYRTDLEKEVSGPEEVTP